MVIHVLFNILIKLKSNIFDKYYIIENVLNELNNNSGTVIYFQNKLVYVEIENIHK